MPDADEFIIPKDLISVRADFRSFSAYLTESWRVGLISDHQYRNPSQAIFAEIVSKMGYLGAFSTLVAAANLASGECFREFGPSLAS